MNPIARILVIAAAGVLAASCAKQIEAPGDAGVCWQMITLQSGAVKFNKVSKNEPNIESCAGSLDGMRLRFMSLGGVEQITGAYQGNFLFVGPQGVYMSQSLDGARYLLMVHAAGMLVRPSELPSQ
jgi:hypothetical protein